MVNLAVAYPIFVLVYPFLPCNYTQLNVGGSGGGKKELKSYDTQEVCLSRTAS